MNTLNKVILLLLLSSLYTTVHAAVDGVVGDVCSVFSDKDGAGDKKGETGGKEDEEEPECE